jgi:hypothetical protein
MDTSSRRRTHARALSLLWVAALALACCSSTTWAAVAATPKKSKPKIHVLLGPLTGKWSGKYDGAFSGKFKLHWTQTGSHLVGSITLSNPGGTYDINGTVRRNKIGFGALDAGATYTGTVSGKTMSGHYKSPQGGGSWSASKTS